jgi:hypothetical protein
MTLMLAPSFESDLHKLKRVAASVTGAEIHLYY